MCQSHWTVNVKQSKRCVKKVSNIIKLNQRGDIIAHSISYSSQINHANNYLSIQFESFGLSEKETNYIFFWLNFINIVIFSVLLYIPLIFS